MCRLTIRYFLFAVTLMAFFFAGWTAKSRYDVIYTSPSPVLVEGVVMKKRGDLVAVSLGIDDGLANGLQVKFKRNGKDICDGQVVKTSRNQSAVSVGKSEVVFEGDLVVAELR